MRQLSGPLRCLFGRGKRRSEILGGYFLFALPLLLNLAELLQRLLMF